MVRLKDKDTELNDVKCDSGDCDETFSENNLSSLNLLDAIKHSRASNGKDRKSDGQNASSYGSVGQPPSDNTIVFREVTVVLNTKTILKRVSGMVSAGEILAVMGPTGAGKSTLLSALAARIPVTSGSLTLNGQPVQKIARRKISYVLQADRFYPTLTLRETLTFVSLLRLSDSMSYKQKIHRMLEIVDALGLKKCLDTKMGSGVNFLLGGLSGGERKRASIACELIANPDVLLIDEPTSGLDSVTARDMMSSLAKLSTQQKKTVVATIHQPFSQLFQMFSKVLLLVEGEVAYFGSGDKIIDFFADIGLTFDPLSNPADFIMEQVTSDKEKVQMIVNAAYAIRTREDWPKELRENYKTTKDSAKDVMADVEWPTGFMTQYMTVTRRAFILSRDRFLSSSSLVHVIKMLIIGLVWFQIPRTEETMNDRLGVLFFINGLTQTSRCTSSLFLIYDIWGVFESERSAGFYRLSAYYLGTVTAEAPFLLALTVCYATTCYWVTGLTPAASSFFYFLLLVLLGVLIAQGLGMLIGILVPPREFAVSIANTIILFFLISAGFYNAHASAWIQYASFDFYIWSALVKIEWINGDEFQCEPANSTSYPEYCTNGTTFPGAAFLRRHNMINVSIYFNVTMALCLMIFFYVSSYLSLRFLRPRPRS